MLLKPDLEENIDINPTSENLLRTIEDFEGASRLDLSKEDISRSDRKRAIAFNLSTDKLGWSASFLDMLLFYQIYRDWNEVGTRIGDPSGAAYLRPYIEEWVARDFMPEDYRFKYLPGAMPASENVKKLLSSLDGGMDALAIHNAVFDFAKANNIEPKALFAELYRALLGKERGPRLGKLLFALGVERVKKDLI